MATPSSIPAPAVHALARRLVAERRVLNLADFAKRIDVRPATLSMWGADPKRRVAHSVERAILETFGLSWTGSDWQPTAINYPEPDEPGEVLRDAAPATLNRAASAGETRLLLLGRISQQVAEMSVGELERLAAELDAHSPTGRPTRRDRQPVGARPRP